MVHSRIAVLAGLALTLAAAGPLGAQVATIGVKGGVNVADVSIEEAEQAFDTENVNGFIGGLFLRLGGPVFAIQPEVLYSEKGFSTPDLAGVSADVDLGYVEVPLLLSARLPFPIFRPFAYLGPVFSFEVSCDVEIVGGPVSGSTPCEDVDVRTEDTDIGLGVGGGIDIDIGRASLIGDVRYNIGLRDIAADDGIDVDFVSAKNRTWSLMAGIGFPLL